MEYVIVVFPTNRLAYIDGERSGYTNDPLRVDAGTHVFDLGSYANYEPTSRKVVVEGTTVLDPMPIVFTKKADA
jgi:hypothetical protein